MSSSGNGYAHTVDHEDDPYGEQDGYIKGTDFSLPYYSEYSRIYERTVKQGLLRHVNCGYLSTEGVAPTLLALKQHAQSLCILIQQLTPTSGLSEIGDGSLSRVRASGGGGSDPLTIKAHLNDAFDFLCDLSTPYTNDDANHNVPLTALLNEVRARDEVKGVSYHCPFADAPKPRRPGDELKPYATHQNLIMHANACLERLDHEFSTTGGLLSILPTDQEGRETLNHARNTLLGQWLAYTQHLVTRMHELERSYNNALDALAGEAVIPAQHLSVVGPTAATEGHSIVYPQDKYVLVNAGDDIFQYIHQILDKQEVLLQAQASIANNAGVVSTASVVSEEASVKYTGGVVYVDIPSRFYRLAGQGKNTLFVLPAHDVHPATAHTRLLEASPTVVTSVSPADPSRVTVLEKRYTERIVQAQQDAVDVVQLRRENERQGSELKSLLAEHRNLVKVRDELLASLDGKNRVKVRKLFKDQATVAEVQTQLEKLKKEKKELEEVCFQWDAHVKRLNQEIQNLNTRSRNAPRFAGENWTDSLSRLDQKKTPSCQPSSFPGCSINPFFVASCLSRAEGKSGGLFFCN
ncbi:hypothetical protein QBC40DRAFT_307515 [Triangularia verruculosa]|uniref:Uncharacterized protein n=1 Tax=Triangularia verruculosa TaxID=2587418 RepID=A0AAN6XFS9_9PEZI|nr:hypothetical protein QBC40DRAFT_307515 [Triangularia verruculosa]